MLPDFLNWSSDINATNNQLLIDPCAFSVQNIGTILPSRFSFRPPLTHPRGNHAQEPGGSYCANRGCRVCLQCGMTCPQHQKRVRNYSQVEVQAWSRDPASYTPYELIGTTVHKISRMTLISFLFSRCVMFTYSANSNDTVHIPIQNASAIASFVQVVVIGQHNQASGILIFLSLSLSL